MIDEYYLAKKSGVIADYKNGMPIRAIRRKHGINLNVLYAWLKEDSVELRGGYKTRHREVV